MMSVSIPKVHFVIAGVNGKKDGVCGLRHKAGRWTDEEKIVYDPFYGTGDQFCAFCLRRLKAIRPDILILWADHQARVKNQLHQMSLQGAINKLVKDDPNWKPTDVPLTSFYHEEFELSPKLAAFFSKVVIVPSSAIDWAKCGACKGTGFVWERCMTTGEEESDVCLECEGSGRG